MSNQQLMDAGRTTMDETDQAIERSKQVHYESFFFSPLFLSTTVYVIDIKEIAR